MNNLIIGNHVSFNKNTQLLGSVKEALSYNANTFMFYTGAPQNTMRSKVDSKLVEESLKELQENNIDINKITIKNLNFSYENNEVLKDVNLNIYKGDWIFINGITGSGKSTLFKIITKQIDFDSNSIFINKTNLNDIKEEIIRNSIMYVDQKLNLINASIKENIFMGDTFDFKPVKTALVDEMLKTNKIDYDYKIDSTNSNLSGGQISKIIIAQALNSKRDFIIFDETTSNLDIKTERRIFDNIKRKYKDKTIIVITHRKSNINYFNKVFLFNDGKIIKLKKGEIL